MARDVVAFNGVPLTKREVLIARMAFQQGAEWMFSAGDAWAAGDDPATCRRNARHKRAADAFPWPTITRARVLKDPEYPDLDYQWTVINRQIIYLYKGENRGQVEHFPVTPKRLALWNDLIARPTEEVEDAE